MSQIVRILSSLSIPNDRLCWTRSLWPLSLNFSTLYLHPVLNWAKCLFANLLRTVRPTMIRFLIELTISSPNMVRKVQRTILRNEMQASTQTRQKPSRQHDPKCRLNQVKNHPSQGNSTNYYIILRPRNKTAPPTSQQIF